MFSFFTKKNFLVDHLEGFIDIHNHILPGIDDGAKTIEESISLIKGFGEFGVKDFICTPHIMHNYYENTTKTIKKSFKDLKKALKEKNLENFNINFAAEHMIDSEFEDLLKNNKILPLNRNYILVEMSYMQASINFDHAISQVINKSFIPILAHPERYFYLHERKFIYGKYKNMGISFQLNLLSLSEYYGPDVRKIALQLLKNNLFDYVASDVHNIRQLEKIKEIKLSKKITQQVIYLIQTTNKYFS